jgi:hypothetical protein
MPLGMATSNGPTVRHDRLNMEYCNNDNMSQWHYAKIKENELLVKSNIPIPNLEANTLNHTALLKTTVTFSYIYIYIYISFFNKLLDSLQHTDTQSGK